MFKKLFKIGMLASALMFACNANAQSSYEYPRYGFWSNWSIGGAVSYQWEFEHGGFTEWLYGTNLGVKLFFEKELNHVWAVRIVGDDPGLFAGKTDYVGTAYNRGDFNAYDRYGKAGFDIKFSINNAIKGYDPERRFSIYLLGGTGATFRRHDVDLGNVGMYMQVGLGLSNKCGEHSTWFFEVGSDVSADFPKPLHQWHDMNGFLSLGYMYNFGPTQEDLDLIAQRNALTQDMMDAKNAEIEKLNKDLKDSKVKESQLINKVRELENAQGGGNIIVKDDGVADSLRKVIEGYEKDKDNFYAMPFSILYGVDQSNVPADQMKKVKAIADVMKDCDNNFEIIGYCDYSGSDEYNQKLSQKRADKVKDLLVNKYGIDENRLTATGKGKSVKFGDLKNAVNRRVSFYRK